MSNYEQRYQNTTHKVNLTGGEISTILYYLDGALSNIGDDKFDSDTVERIYAELQSVTDNYYAQLEEQNNNLRTSISDEVDVNYAECVDHLVSTMGANPSV